MRQLATMLASNLYQNGGERDHAGRANEIWPVVMMAWLAGAGPYWTRANRYRCRVMSFV